MSIPGLLQIAIYVVLLFAITKPVGLLLFRVFGNDRASLSLVERWIYRLTRVKPEVEQGWVAYAFAMLIFSAVGALATYLIERTQNFLPFNPEGLDAVPPDLAFNTAMSFTTNTNWQSYVPETTMSYFTQMAATVFLRSCTRSRPRQATMARLSRESTPTLRTTTRP
jgi:K+-transporting ATPase ATPase A chain